VNAAIRDMNSARHSPIMRDLWRGARDWYAARFVADEADHYRPWKSPLQTRIRRFLGIR
jgi:hypothetical protein